VPAGIPVPIASSTIASRLRALSLRVTGASPWLVPMLVAAALVFPWLFAVPGVHADEAWALLRAQDLAHGQRPVDGMTFYTGAWHTYLVWAASTLLGPTTTALRLPGALLAVAAVGLVAFTVRRRWGPRTALATGLLLASSPALVTYARFGIEIAALSPFLLATAFACFAAIRQGATAGELALAQIGGLALGLAAHNHVALLPVPFVTFLALALLSRGRILWNTATYGALVGFVLGCLPRVGQLITPEGWKMWTAPSQARGWEFLSDLPDLPRIVLRCWDGAIFYRRYSGGGPLWVIPYAAVAAAVVIAARIRWRVERWRLPEAVAVVAIALVAVLTAALSPWLSIRYEVAVDIAMPVLLGIACGPLLGERAPHPARRVGVAVVAVVVALNVFYLGVDYLRPFLHDGGGLALFPLGKRLVESSQHFVRTNELYRRLVARGVRRVDGGFFIEEPLAARDIGRGWLELGAVEAAPGAPTMPRVRTAVVLYDGVQWNGPWPDVARENARTYGATITRSGVTLFYDPSFPPLFRVYVADPPGAAR